MQKKILTPLGFVRQYNSPKPYCSPSIIIQGNIHLSKYPRERFDRFFDRLSGHELWRIYRTLGEDINKQV